MSNSAPGESDLVQKTGSNRGNPTDVLTSVAGNPEGKIGGNELHQVAVDPCNDSEVRSLDGVLGGFIIRQPWSSNMASDDSIRSRLGEGIVYATSNCGLIVTGKSSLIATYADYVWQKFQRITLLYVSDGGGFGDSVEALVQRGIIWVWRVKTRRNPFETCARASEGWWPKEMTDPATGESSPGCELVPPLNVTYTLRCPKDHVVLTHTSPRALTATTCPTCSTITSTENGTVTTESKITPGFEQTGARAYDGLTSMQFWAMTDLAHRVGRGELVGEKTALGGQICDGEMTFGGNNRSHYGFAQIRAQEWLDASVSIPGLVAPPVWTALEQRADDNVTNLPIYGPKIAGSAKTSDVPSWVGNCLGTRTWKNAEGKDEWRLHLREYRDTDNIPHLCKTRAMPGLLPEYLADPPGAHFTQFNLGYLFTLLDNAAEKALREAKEKYSNAPGLPSGSIGGVEEEGSKEKKSSTVSGAGTVSTNTNRAAGTRRPTPIPRGAGRRPARSAKLGGK